MKTSLSNKLVSIIITTTIIPMIVVFGLQYEIAKDTLHEEIFVKLNTITALKVNTINEIFENLRSDLIVSQSYFNVKSNLPILSTSLPTIHSKIQQSKNMLDTQLIDYVKSKNHINGIYLLDEKGIVVYTTHELNQHQVGQEFFDHENQIFKNSKKDIFLSDEYLDSNGKIRKYYAGPIVDFNDKFVGIIILDINMKSVYELIEDKLGLGETGETLIGKQIGDYAVFINTLRHAPDSAFKLKIHLEDNAAKPIREAVQGISNSGITVDYRSEPIIAVWKHVPITNWGIVAKMDTSEAFKSEIELRNLFIIVSIITTIIITMIGIYSSKQISKPLENLRKVSTQVTKRNLEIKANENISTTEIKDLAKSFNIMIKNLKISNKEIKDITEILDKFALVSITDKNGIITSVNKRFCDVSKYSEKELVGNNHRILKSDKHSPEFYNNLWNTISNGKIWEGQIKNKAKDGSHYWIQTIISPIFDINGEIEKYISMRIDITKNKQNEETIQTQYEEIQKIDIQKDEFTAMISHELKTPLTPILMWAGALKNEKRMGKLNEKQIKATKTIFSCANDLSSLISDIFDSYKLDLEKIEFIENEITLHELMNDAKEIGDKLIGENKITLENSTNDDLIVYGDKKRILQVLKNLLTNAIDFVDSKTGKIEINATAKGENVEFFVKDNGVGIAKEFQDQLFKKFYQIDTSATRKHGGSGLGLSICHGMVKGMKGKIWLDSDAGKGTTFYFSLPNSRVKKE